MKLKFKSLILLICLALTSVSNHVYSSENNPFPSDKELESLSPSNRRALLEYIADREAQRASENPEAFNQEVKDIIQEDIQKLQEADKQQGASSDPMNEDLDALYKELGI